MCLHFLFLTHWLSELQPPQTMRKGKPHAKDAEKSNATVFGSYSMKSPPKPGVTYAQTITE